MDDSFKFLTSLLLISLIILGFSILLSMPERDGSRYFNRGSSDYSEGIPANANPYTHNRDRTEWLDGWIEAKKNEQ